jgi:WD40 repeat protein
LTLTISDFNLHQLAQSRKELIPATIYESLEEYQRFVQQRSHVLARNSELCFSMAASLPDESKPAKEAASRYRQRIERRPWMRWANKPQTANPCIMTLSGHEAVIRACSYSPIAPLIASASDDKTIRIWNAATGEESKTLKGHSNRFV